MRSILVTCALVVGLILGSPVAARAALRVCDATTQPATVAVGVLEPGTGGTQSESEGWFQIDAGTCTRVIATNLNPATLYYLYAKSRILRWTGTTSTKDTAFCINTAKRFFYIDRPPSLCIGAGAQMTRFIYEPVVAPNWTIDLRSP